MRNTSKVFFKVKIKIPYVSVYPKTPYIGRPPLLCVIFNCIFDVLDLDAAQETERFHQILPNVLEAANVRPVNFLGRLAQFAFEKSEQVGDVSFGVLVFGFRIFFCHVVIPLFFGGAATAATPIND